MGLKPELWEKSPFELSGGEKRRVAIAGVIAMDPDVLILDEPTAGLDPHGRDVLLAQIEAYHRQRGQHHFIGVAQYGGYCPRSRPAPRDGSRKSGHV